MIEEIFFPDPIILPGFGGHLAGYGGPSSRRPVNTISRPCQGLLLTRLQGFVDNIQREGLSPVDEAEQMAERMAEYVFNQYQLADALGKSPSSGYTRPSR